MKFKRQKTDKLEIKINAILKRTNRLQNNFDKMEEAYNELKKPLEELLSKPETKDEAEIIRQNSKILMFFDLLNKILSLVSDNPMPIFRVKKNLLNKNKKNKDINELMKEEKEKIEDNNQKIISNYESEIKRMKNILEKVRDDNYEKKLDEKIKIKKNDILITEKKINELKLTIKQRELEQDHEQKKNSKEIILKNLTCDYKIKRKEKKTLDEKLINAGNILKSKQNLIKTYENKIKDLKKQANDLYDISEIKSIKEINKLKAKYKKEEMNFFKYQKFG